MTKKGESPLKDPFIDVFGMTRHKNQLRYPAGAAAALRILNPVGVPAVDYLAKGRDWYMDKAGDVRLITTLFSWYDLQIPVPGTGYNYIKRTFGAKSLTHAVVRVEVPLLAKHKIADLPGLFRIPLPYRPTLSGGRVVKPGKAAEYRSAAKYKREGPLPFLVDYWGGKRSLKVKAEK